MPSKKTCSERTEKKIADLEILYKRIKSCRNCILHKTRTNAVPGTGDCRHIMLIGEAPGLQEDLNGLPFVGSAGSFLTELLSTIRLKRDDVYITNVVKCRPPNNREPTKAEIEACAPYLDMQIALLNPKIVCLLGRVAVNRFLANVSITAQHGKVFELNGRFFIPMYHPAAALYKGSLKDAMYNDMQNLKKLILKLKLDI